MSNLPICAECKGEIENPGRKDRRFCTLECSRAFMRKKWRLANPKSDGAVLTTAAVAEANALRVISLLMAKGYLIYRAFYHGMPYALIACDPVHIGRSIEDAGVYRIEVVGGSNTVSGKLMHPKRNDNEFDVLAIVTTEAVHFKPDHLL